MTIQYSINGGAEIHGVKSDWERIVKRSETDGAIQFTPLAINRWQLASTDMTTWETLRAGQGNALTSLETNDIDDRNTAATYTTVWLRLLAGRQVGVRMVDVAVEFEVQVVS